MTTETHELALEKMSKILGPERAARLLAAALAELGVAEIDTPNTLMRVAQVLGERPNAVEAALGSILSFQATLLGSSLKLRRS